MKVKCLLVDDEPLAIRLLQKHIGQLDFMEVIAVCNNAVKALELVNSQQVDLLFLDIRMPGISGLDLLRTLSQPPATILTTAYREYALEGFELEVIDYLLKPVTFDRFFKSVERYLKHRNGAAVPLPPATEPAFIYIKSGYKHIKIDTADISYIESSKDYIRVYTRDKEVLAKYKISDLEKDLAGKGFLRIHRSFIVNIKNITAFTTTDIEIGNRELPIGESYKEYVFKLFNKKPL